MWRALTTMAFTGRPQSLYETCIAFSHDERPQTRNRFAIADFRYWQGGAAGGRTVVHWLIATRCCLSAVSVCFDGS
jgi:hypothetical protein